MRIAVLCSDLGIRVPGAKGASLHLQAITRAFADCGHDVLLVGVAGHEPPAPSPVEHLLLPHPGRAQGLRREIRKLRFVASLPTRVTATIRDFGPDLLYERLSLFGTAGRRIAATLGVAHAVEVNALLAREEAGWRGLRLARIANAREREVLTGADLRIAVSDEVADQVRQVAGLRDTIVVPNGVDARTFTDPPSRDQARAALGLDPDATWLGFTGALRPWHGLDNAIRALTLLPERCRLLVAGDGPVRAELEGLAERLRVAHRITWLGQVQHGRIPTVLAALDIATAPYPRTPEFSFSPLKAYEYMAAGVPIVASDIGQLSTIVTADAGLLVPPGDAAALAGACAAVVADPGRFRDGAQRSRRAVLRDHSWTRRAETIVHSVRQEGRRALAA